MVWKRGNSSFTAFYAYVSLRLSLDTGEETHTHTEVNKQVA